LINIICDHAMLTGFIKSAEILTTAIVSGCAADLTLPRSEVLQAEIAETRPPAAPPAPTRQPQAAAPNWKERWQPVLLAALLIVLLLGAFWGYPLGFDRLKELWRTQFQGMAVRTTAPPPRCRPRPPAAVAPGWLSR
jgi:hypothetical protein